MIIENLKRQLDTFIYLYAGNLEWGILDDAVGSEQVKAVVILRVSD